VLREKLGKGHILLNDDQRRRLAVKGKALGRKALHKIATIVTPDTILL
jgi:putative transposase